MRWYRMQIKRKNKYSGSVDSSIFVESFTSIMPWLHFSAIIKYHLKKCLYISWYNGMLSLSLNFSRKKNSKNEIQSICWKLNEESPLKTIVFMNCMEMFFFLLALHWSRRKSNQHFNGIYSKKIIMKQHIKCISL